MSSYFCPPTPSLVFFSITFATFVGSIVMSLNEIFAAFKNLSILVIGDLMLDTYLKGSVERESPEAPIPVLKIEEKYSFPGGAANVALNCKALGANVSLAGVIGEDEEGRKLLTQLNVKSIATQLIFTIPERSTTEKIRVLKNEIPLIRIDREETQDLVLKWEHRFIEKTLKFLQIEKPNLVIIEDYNKGLLTENVIDQILHHCQVLNIPVAVDPKKKNFLNYKGVMLFKPNLKEVQEGLNLSINSNSKEELEAVHQQLKKDLNHQLTLITLSEKGVYYSDGMHSKIIPAYHREVVDVSGAGDTVISVAAMVWWVTQSLEVAAEWANIAGGLACEQKGVKPISPELLKNELKSKLNIK